MTASKHGTFVWYEMLATDTTAAKDFYTRLIGWTTQEWNEMGQPYTMWVAGEKPFAGLMELPEEARSAGAPPHWLAYVSVDDVDQTTAKAVELGATVLVPAQDIPKIGRFSVIADPQGAVISPFKSFEASSDASDEMAMLQFSWHELSSSDLETSWTFYSKLFGWKVLDDMDMGDAGLYRIYGLEGKPPLGGMYKKPAEFPGPPAWLFYVMVEDVSALVDQVTSLGGTVLTGPMKVPGGGSILMCLDSQGAAFALHSEGKS